MPGKIDAVDLHAGASGDHPVEDSQGDGNAHARFDDVRQQRILLAVVVVGIPAKAQFIGHETGEGLRALPVAHRS